jgi:PAS domain S-box-containing protein
MKKRKSEPQQARELRRRAEELLHSRMPEVEELAPSEILNLLHELQVHQIELEMQNDELRQSQVVLEESRARFADLYDFAPVGYLTLDEAGLILEANLTAAGQLAIPRSRLLNRPFHLLAAREDRENLRRHIRQVYQSQERQSTEIRLALKEGGEFFVLLDSLFIQDVTGKGLCRTSFTDITRRKQAEEALQQAHDDLELRVGERTTELRLANEHLLQEVEERRLIAERLSKSEERLRTLFHTAGSIIMSISPGHLILEFNQEAERITGWQRQEVLGKDAFQLFIHEDARSRVAAEMASAMAGELTRGFEFPLQLRDGGTRLFLWNANLVPVPEGGAGEVIWVGHDITELKQAEEALRQSGRQLRLLASQLLTIQEKERGRISRELHDELGQSLIVLKLQLQSLLSKLPETQQVLHGNGQEMLHFLDETVENVRRLSQDLSPFILEDFGLPAAIKYLLGNIREHGGIKITSARLDEVDQLFSPEAQITIYRVLQECLTNIIKHAQATQVSFEIIKRDGEVTFKVIDDGKGFDVRQARSRQAKDTGIGLAAMKERLRLMRGALKIQSQKGKGTSVTFTIPLDLKENEHGGLPDSIG